VIQRRNISSAIPRDGIREPCPNDSGLDTHVELSLNQEKLVLTMAEVSGSIWVLDNVDQ